MDEIVNRVAESGLVTLDLDRFYTPGERVLIDLAPVLEHGLLLREKPFRDYVKQNDWQAYRGKLVALTCSTDALIPAWAWMLVVSALQPFAARVFQGDIWRLNEQLFLDALSSVDWNQFRGQRVLVKGCSRAEAPPSVFAEITFRLQPVAQSVMFGEACSAVPVFKRKKES